MGVKTEASDDELVGIHRNRQILIIIAVKFNVANMYCFGVLRVLNE